MELDSNEIEFDLEFVRLQRDIQYRLPLLEREWLQESVRELILERLSAEQRMALLAAEWKWARMRINGDFCGGMLVLVYESPGLILREGLLEGFLDVVKAVVGVPTIWISSPKTKCLAQWQPLTKSWNYDFELIR